MRYHEALARTLRSTGTEVVFGVLGDANLFAMDSFQRLEGGRFVSLAHEGGAVLAAAGYTSTSGRLGVATITHGPALTNVVTALVDATRSRTPLVLVAGDTDPADRDNLQNVDQRSIVLPTGAGFEAARSPQTVAEDVLRAMARARAERRPVVLDVPAGFMWAEVDEPVVGAVPSGVRRAAPDPASLDDALGVIGSARRPIVLGGRGAAGSREALVALAERLGAPVATTLRGKGLFAGHPHDLGIFGTLSHDVANAWIDRADCVVALGAGLNAWTTAKGGLLEGKRVVHVDDDPGSLALAGATVPVLGDAATVAAAIVEMLDAAELPATGFASSALEIALKEHEVARNGAEAPARGIDVEVALRRIDAAFPRERTLVVDDGRFIITSFRELGVARPEAYVHTCSFASIGLAVATSIGAQVGAPGRPALVVCGDGGFMSAGLNEFSAAVRHGLDTVVVVMNDQAYGAEHMQFRARGMDPAISTFDWPDFAPVAEAMGGTGITVRDHADLEAALERIATRDRPVLIDVKLDPDHVPTPGY